MCQYNNKIYLVRKVIYLSHWDHQNKHWDWVLVVLVCNCKLQFSWCIWFISSHKKRNRQCCRKEWQNSYNILLFAACKKDQATKFSLGSCNKPVHLGLKCIPWDPTNNSKVMSRILLVLMWETVDKKRRRWFSQRNQKAKEEFTVGKRNSRVCKKEQWLLLVHKINVEWWVTLIAAAI
jgi:hypothetical protein